MVRFPDEILPPEESKNRKDRRAKKAQEKTVWRKRRHRIFIGKRLVISW